MESKAWRGASGAPGPQSAHTCYNAHVKARGQAAGAGLSFHQMGPRDQTQVSKFGHKHLYTLGTILSALRVYF